MVFAARSITVDVRVIAASYRDLKAAVERVTLREDLYCRLWWVVLDGPPLRARRDYIALLVEHFRSEVNESDGLDITAGSGPDVPLDGRFDRVVSSRGRTKGEPAVAAWGVRAVRGKPVPGDSLVSPMIRAAHRNSGCSTAGSTPGVERRSPS